MSVISSFSCLSFRCISSLLKVLTALIMMLPYHAICCNCFYIHVRPMSHVQFSRTILSREFSRRTKLQVWRGESRDSLTVVQLYFQIELCSILCNSVDRMLNADWPVVIIVYVLLLFGVRCTYSSFCLIYFNLFKSEMEWSDVKMLQLIELYEERPYLCDKVTACN